MEYIQFFGLKAEPFANIPNPKYYFDSPQHAAARNYLIHAAQGVRGLGVLTGEIGTGKTMIIRKILADLNSLGGFRVGLVILTHSNFPPRWLYIKVANLMGLRDLDKSEEIVSRISDRLMELYHRGERTIILIDEANKLRDETILEELRGLLNLEISDTRLITFILSGLPELDSYLAQNKALYQRVAIKVRLRPMGPETVKSYIHHRLTLVDGSSDVFTEPAVHLIIRYSEGRARVVNTLCDNALFEAFVQKRKPVDEYVVERVISNLGYRLE